MKRSDYIRVCKTIVKKLFDLNCLGKGSVYIAVLRSGIPSHLQDQVAQVADSLVKQGICHRKKKAHGWKYYLNMDRYDKIVEILD